MTDLPSPPQEEVNSPSEETEAQVQNKSFFSKILTLGLLVAIFIILMGVLWQRYLEPRFQFDNVSGGQSTAEAISLAPIVGDTPPSTFQGKDSPSLPEKSTKEALVTEILAALQAKINGGTEVNIENQITRLKKNQFSLKALRLLESVEKGLLSISELRGFLSQYPEIGSEKLKKLSFLNHLLSFEELHTQATTLRESLHSKSDSDRFLDKVKKWLKSLIKMEKTEVHNASSAHEKFLLSLQTHNLQASLDAYAALSPELQKNMKDIYEQLELRDELQESQRQILLNLLQEEN